MKKLVQILIAVLIPSFATSAWALDFATSQEVADCVTLQGKAAEHAKWSSSLEEFMTNKKLTASQVNRIAKMALNKVYEDIYAVRDLVGMNEEHTVLEQTPKLLRRIKSGTLEIEQANELMLDKLNQLDRAMFDTLQLAGQSIAYCDAFAGRSRAVLDKSTDSPSSKASSSSVQ